MPSSPAYKRVLLKISGEGFCHEGGFGIEAAELENIAHQCIEVAQMGVQLGIVVGGGNFIRGATFSKEGHIPRATAIAADGLLKATKVDGIYSADPKKDKTAELYSEVTYQQVLEKQLRVMDLTAITLCMERKLPLIVFNLKQPGNIARVLRGET